MDDIRGSEAAAIIEAVKGLSQVEAVPGLDGLGIIIPGDKELRSLKPLLDEFRDRPERRSGTVGITDLRSFSAFMNRFKGGPSVVFSDDAVPRLVGIVDYHAETFTGDPAFCRHRVLYDFPISDEWKAWEKKDAEGMTQADFAEFVEDRVGDLVVATDPTDPLVVRVSSMGGTLATPAKVLEVSRGFSVHANEAVKSAINLQSGETQVQYESAHSDAGGGSVKVPGWFLIAIPVFRNGASYLLAVRLRYRLQGGRIIWFYQLHQPRKVFDHAIAEAEASVAEQTGLPVYRGRPEAGSTTQGVIVDPRRSA